MDKIRVTAKSQQTNATRAKVIECALILFNEKGFESCTTHTIATAAGLSPGNLYYHFKNKEEIAEEVAIEIGTGLRSLFSLTGLETNSLSFPEFLESFFDFLFHYKFFFRDFPLLIRANPRIGKVWKTEFQQSRADMKSYANRWVKSGDMKPFETDQALDAFLDNVFALIFFGPAYQEFIDDSLDRKTFKAHLERVLEFLHPYHTSQGLKAISRYRNNLNKLKPVRKK